MNLLDGKDKLDAYHLTIDYSKNFLSDSYSGIFQKYDRVLNGSIQRTKIDKIQSSGYVIDTLEAALWCFINTKSYSECIFQAINLGGDTDTIACIAGGLAGIHYGLRNIPVNWIQTLAKKHNINSMIDKFIDSVQ
jgi:ADP-ribosylglycohydrolase